jgi:hypothetical protein
MLKNKVIDLLRTFTVQELKKFGFFLKCELHNRNNKIKLLYEELMKFAPRYDSNALTAEYLFQKLHRGKKYNSALLRNNLSDLLIATEDFLVLLQISSDTPERYLMLNKQLIKRNLHAHFRMKTKQAFVHLDGQSLRSENYFYYRHRYIQQEMTVKRHARHEYSDLSEEYVKAERALADFTAAHLGSFYMTYITLGYAQMETLNPYIYKHSMTILSDPRVHTEPSNNVFYLFHKLSGTNEEKDYFEARDHLLKSEQLFDQDELQNFYISMHNYVLNKVNGGKAGFLEEYLFIVKGFIEKEYYMNIDGTMSQPFFRNTVMANVKLGRFDEAKQFVEKYHSYLEEDSKQNNYLYSHAYISFNEKNFVESMNKLAKVKYNEYLLKLQTENLILMNCYELNMFEECLYRIDSLSHYLNKIKNIPEEYYALYSGFISFLRRLIKLRSENNMKGLGELHSDTMNARFTSKNWLTEKINELMK